MSNQLSVAQINTAMQSPDHLKRWLEKSGRRWLVFNAIDLIDGLPWPHGVEALTQVISAYRAQRLTIPTGDFEEQVDPTTSEKVRVPIMKDELPTYEELDRCVRYLVSMLKVKDPLWSLEGPAL